MARVLREPASDDGDAAEPPPAEAALLQRLLGMSRYGIGLAVAGTIVAAAALLVYGAVEVVRMVGAVIVGASAPGAGTVVSTPMLLAISVVDAFLVAVMLYVIAIGLYQLFIRPLRLPPWFLIEDLHDLESKLIGVVISVLGVVFLGRAVTWDAQSELQGYGIATALVIGALAYYLDRMPRKRGPTGKRAHGPDPFGAAVSDDRSPAGGPSVASEGWP